MTSRAFWSTRESSRTARTVTQREPISIPVLQRKRRAHRHYRMSMPRGCVDWTQLEPIRQNIFQTLKINHINYIAWSENTIVIIKFPKRLEKIKREEYLSVTRISPWHARSLRDHELSQDGAIKPANTGNSFNFLLRILGGWAGQSLPFKSPHLCIFTAWLADKFKNKRQQAFPPEKHSP